MAIAEATVQQRPNPIELYRRAKGMRQQDLAKQVGVSENTIVSWERGAQPQPQRVPMLAMALGVEPVRLLEELTAWQPPPAGTPRRRRRVDVPQPDETSAS